MALFRSRADDTSPLSRPALSRALRLTHLGMMAEALWRAFWPLVAVCMVLLSSLMLGLQDVTAVEVVWALSMLGALMLIVSGVAGALRLTWPSREDAIARLDATLPGRPIRALLDEQALGGGDAATDAVWAAHQARMAAKADKAQRVQPDLSLSSRDPYALRYAAALFFAMALIFGSVWRISSVADMAPGSAQAAMGPSWEGWIEPPRYTGLPTLYLNDIDGDSLEVPQGAQITLRFYGQPGDLTLAETVSGRVGELPSASDPAQSFPVTQGGELRIDGPGGKVWTVVVIPDQMPEILPTGQPEAEPAGPMSLSFTAQDDYGIANGRVQIALDLDAIDRRHGLSIDPEPRAEIIADLPLPISGDRSDFVEAFREDFSEHPWVHLPVTFTFSAQDALGQEGVSEPLAASLPGRRFFDPIAAAVIEQRRDLLWSRENAPRIAQVLRAISYQPDGLFRSETAYLRLRVILRRLETLAKHGLTEPQRDELAQALWDLAIILEEGDIGDALERMRAAQERLSEAMKNGASDQEIARLMQELQQATNDYLRQLSRQAQQQQQQNPGDPNAQQNQNQMQMTQNDLQQMMDRIQELMEQGRFAEAQQALEEFQQMMENLRITQQQGGQGGQSPGQQAMEGLAETLREQQGLSDEAFRELQEQFNPNAQTGESQQNEGRNGGQGRGQSHDGQGQPGQQGQGDGQTGQAQNGQGQDGQQQPGQGMQQGLADRQQALRQELQRQQQGLPGAGTPGGDAARDALDRAGRAMDDAEDALRQDDFAGAIDDQSRAMEALRDGMQELGEQMAQQQQGQPGQGNQPGEMQGASRDPLGRNPGSNGSLGTDESLLQGDDVYRRARELLDEIRRRSGEGERPDAELDYLRRLLDRF
ncbi:MAG: TIGR02302 family protein [Rhodobacteraceae bacterium]|nr:TIGR02302 family protein [Paracoccaceae bacterium]